MIQAEGKPVSHTHILRVSGNGSHWDEDLVVNEEPLELRLGFGPSDGREQRSLSVTMRTPGHDLELCMGFLKTEGIIRGSQDVVRIEHCGQVDESQFGNVVKAELNAHCSVDLDKLTRHFYTTSSCGVCGKSSLEAVYNQGIQPIDIHPQQLNAKIILNLVQKMEEGQRVFKHTGGLHSAVLFDVNGEILLAREDIGRHNAVDKVIGAALMQGNEHFFENAILFLSGRAGFELVQKAVVAGIPIVASIGAPSSLSIQLAEAFQVTLIGFVRGEKFNVYTHAERLVL